MSGFRRRSIRFRLTAWYTLVLIAALALFSGLIWFSLRSRLLGEVDEDLAHQAGSFVSFVETEARELPLSRLKDEMAEFCQGLPGASYVELRDSAGTLEFRYPAAPASPGGRVKTVGGSLLISGESFRFVMGTSLRSIGHTLELLQLLLLSLVPVVIAIAGIGGAWLSKRALQPVDDITTAARTIGIDNLSQRLPTPGTGDELQRLTEVWNSMLERLEDAVKTLSQFAADASHELRTPLAVIRTSAELALRRARSPESYRESLGAITEEAERMTQLVDDLLFLARSGAQAAEMPKEPLDLRALLEEACAELQGLADSRQIALRLPLEASAVPVSGNKSALRRLFLALLDNALKYSRPHAEVRIAIASDGARAVVSIQDFGAGIAPEDLAHIFKRFYRADEARTEGGFGLGLSLAQTIAEAHGATIGVTSTQGEGSTFTVAFEAGSAVPSGTMLQCRT